MSLLFAELTDQLISLFKPPLRMIKCDQVYKISQHIDIRSIQTPPTLSESKIIDI